MTNNQKIIKYLHLLLPNTSTNSLNAVGWGCWGSIYERSDSVKMTRRTIIGELDSCASVPKMVAVIMETTDRSCQACIPPLTLRHCFGHGVYPLGVCKSLIVYYLPRFCNAKNGNLSTCTKWNPWFVNIR